MSMPSTNTPSLAGHIQMPNHKKHLALYLLMFLLVVFGTSPVRSATPSGNSSYLQNKASINWNKVAKDVVIRRDSYGIPHILAKNERSAFFGLGYAQAEDHIDVIAKRLLMGRGDASRYLGKKYVDNDFEMQRLDNLSESRKDLSRVSPAFRNVVRSYAAGLNYYVSSHESILPDWISKIGKFTAADVMAHIRSRSVHTILSHRTTDKLLDKYESRGHAQREPLRDGPGSNAFALAGSRTDTGHPILLANPHLMWSAGYWEAQITVPGDMNFFGNTLAGYPVLWAGFNQSLGWGNTVNHADLDDIYALKIDPKHPDRYMFEGHSVKLKKRTILVKVLNDTGDTTVRKREFWYSALGPVILKTDGYVFVIKSSRLDAPLSFEGFYRLEKANNLNEFLNVFKNYPVFSCNFIYADKQGNILYLWQARIPKRADDGTNYSLDIHIHSMQHVWNSLHSFADMPMLLNPKHGVVMNSNNPPWWASPKDWINPGSYPSYFEHGPLALRPQMAMKLLESRNKYSNQDVIKLAFNSHMLLADRVLPDLLTALRKTPASSRDAKTALRILQSWDRSTNTNSRGAVLFQHFWDTYSKALPQPFAEPWNGAEATTTPRGLANPDLAVRYVVESVRWTRKQYGSATVSWGHVHRLRSRRYDLPGSGASGAYGVFGVVSYAKAPDKKKVVGYINEHRPLAGFGSNWIMLVDFSNPVKAWSVLGEGESGHPDSPHSDDQLKLFQEHKLRPVWFTKHEIMSHLQKQYHPH